MLGEQERVYLGWFDRMAKATHNLTEIEHWSLEAWLAAGELRSTWEGWKGIIGPMPPQPGKKLSPGQVGMESQRRSA